MEFREATDVLFSKIDHDELAKAMGVSVASVRQARLNPSAAAHRSAPNGWERAAARLAKARLSELQALIRHIDEGARPHS